MIKDWWVGHLTHSSSFNSELEIHRLSVGRLDFAGRSIICFRRRGHLRATWVFSASSPVQVSPSSCAESASKYCVQVLGHSGSRWRCLALFLPTVCRNLCCVLAVDSHKHFSSLLHDYGFTWAARPAHGSDSSHMGWLPAHSSDSSTVKNLLKEMDPLPSREKQHGGIYTFPVDGQSDCLGSSPPFSCCIQYWVGQKVWVFLHDAVNFWPIQYTSLSK